MKDAVVRLVREVGTHLLSWQAEGRVQGEWQGRQYHANADRWAHEQLCDGLTELDPAIPIASEEDASGKISLGGRAYWLIDPIDGTASYAQGYAGYVTQVALMVGDEPVLAVVFAPRFQQLFVAEKGMGATRDGVALPCEARNALTLIDNAPVPRGAAADLYAAFGFERYLESGGIALKICRVAEGTADAFVKTVLVRDWDLAAPHLVLREAGGRLSDAAGADITYGATGAHAGVIAARDRALASRIAEWNRALERGGPCETPSASAD